LDWHVHTGHKHAAWADWSGAFTTNFSSRIHVGEWLRLVEERLQKVDESSIEYTLDNQKLLRVAILLNDEKVVAFLIDGLASWQHDAVMTANRPADVTEFIQWIRALETLGIASRVFSPTSSATSNSASNYTQHNDYPYRYGFKYYSSSIWQPAN
jgi:hypothetical protein